MFAAQRAATRPLRAAIIAFAFAAAALIITLGIILSVKTPHGEIVVELAPGIQADDVKINVEGNGEVKIADAKHGWTINVREGRYNVQLAGNSDRFDINHNTITVSRNKKTHLTVTRKPALAVTDSSSPTTTSVGSSPITTAVSKKQTISKVSEYVGHQGQVLAVAYSRDGRRAISGGSDRTARVWNVASGECIAHLLWHVDRVRCVALSSDGRLALTGAMDSSVCLWEVDGAKRLHTFDAHAATVRGVAFSPADNFAASASEDGTVRIFLI